jgi:phage terminase large subunit GpA-like protein
VVIQSYRHRFGLVPGDPALAGIEAALAAQMHDIICPHCGKAFKIDEAGYADILKQVRDSAFEQQLHERLELAEQDKRNAVELATTRSPANCRRPPRPRTPRSRAEGQLDAARSRASWPWPRR